MKLIDKVKTMDINEMAKFLTELQCEECFYHSDWKQCNLNKYCYYKQLQQLKQENEQLQEKYKLDLDTAHCNYSQKQDEYLNLLAAMKKIKTLCKENECNVVAIKPMAEQLRLF